MDSEKKKPRHLMTIYVYSLVEAILEAIVIINQNTILVHKHQLQYSSFELYANNYKHLTEISPG